MPIEEIIKLYEEGKSSLYIAKLYNLKDNNIILKLLREYNIKIRNSKENMIFIKEKIESGKTKWFKEHKEEASKIGKKNFQRNLQKSGLSTEEYQKQLAKKCFKKYGREHYIKMAKLGGPASAKANREKKPYFYFNCRFDSKQEMEVAKIFFEEFGYVPIERVNCHVKIDGSEFDFRLDNLFIEWHPWDRKLTFEKYYEKRKNILEKNNFKEGLIVFDKLNNVRIFCEVIKNSNNLSTLLLFDK